MADESNTYLNQRLAALEREKAQLQAALRQARLERRAAVEERDGLRAEVRKLEADRDGWKEKAEAAPSDYQKQVAELEGKIRDRDYRDGFRSEAIKAGVRPEAVDDLYQLSGLTPPPDGELDPAKLAEFLSAAKSSRGWAFGATSPEPPGQWDSTQGPPPGSGRSVSAPPATPVRYTRNDINFPGWQQARPELVEALARGTATFADQ